jgi:hypothetical protein
MDWVTIDLFHTFLSLSFICRICELMHNGIFLCLRILLSDHLGEPVLPLI